MENCTRQTKQEKFTIINILLITLLLLLPCRQFFSQTGWQWQWPYPQGNALKSISFIATDADDVVADDGWAAGDLGTVIFTPDGGATWKNIDIGTTENLNCIFMHDRNTIFVVGENGTIYFLFYDGTSLDVTQQISNTTKNLNAVTSHTNGCTWIAGDNGTVLRSTDLGVTWNQQNVIYNYNLNSIHNIECTSAWAVGSNGFIMNTTDWGNTWTIQSTPTSSSLSAVSIGAFEHIRAVGNLGTMLLSTDEGTTWTIEDCGTSAHLYDVFNIGYARAYAVGTGGTILETTNKGESWEQRYSGTTATLYDIEHQYGTDDLWVVGHYGIVLQKSRYGTYFVPRTGPTGVWNTGVEFSDENTGWAVGIDLEIAGPPYGIFWKTTDGGTIWIGRPTLAALNALDIVNEDLVWFVGEDGFIKHTNNCGGYWVTQTSPVLTDLNALCFIDENNGWAVGDLGEIIHTSNSGNNWIRQSSTTPKGLYGVYFVNENKGWAVGLDTTIVHTIDGGQTWERQILNVSTGGLLFDVFFIDEMHGWVVGVNGIIYLTTDGSATWQEIESGTDKILNSVYFLDNDNGWIVGDAGTILSSTDGGFTWNPQFSRVATNYLNSVHFIDSQNGWVVGEGATILHTTDGGGPVTDGGGPVTDGEEEISINPTHYYLSQNYPNPFNPSTKIKFTIPDNQNPLSGGARGGSTSVQLSVYDVLGREVTTLVNEEKPAGEYEVEFSSHSGSVRNLTSGVYFYRLQINDIVETKKMLILK